MGTVGGLRDLLLGSFPRFYRVGGTQIATSLAPIAVIIYQNSLRTAPSSNGFSLPHVIKDPRDRRGERCPPIKTFVKSLSIGINQFDWRRKNFLLASFTAPKLRLNDQLLHALITPKGFPCPVVESNWIRPFWSDYVNWITSLRWLKTRVFPVHLSLERDLFPDSQS